MSTEPTPSSATPETESAAPSSSGLPQAAPQAAWPERVETGEHQVSYRATVAAPAHELWAMLADPHRHHEADGSGTVRPKVSGPHRLAVGDRFRVAMRKYGVPYTMTLTATAVDEDELVEWAHPGGHRWRWAFRDNGDGTTEVNTEKLTALRPDLFIISGHDDPGKFAKVKEMGTPVVAEPDFLENTPLGRAEWIKYDALFVNTEKVANEKYDEIAKKYHETTQLTAKVKTRPSVLYGSQFKGVWYIKSNENYSIQFLRDAGGEYVFGHPRGSLEETRHRGRSQAGP